MMQPFTPGRTQTASVTASAGSLTLDANAPVLRLLNTGSVLVFAKFGTGAQTAAVTDFPLVPNVPMLLTKGVGADTLSLIGAAAGPSVVYVTTGSGG